MPVFQNPDGSLAVVFKSGSTGREVYVTDDPRPQVSAIGRATAAYDTAEALAQDPKFRDLPEVPDVLFHQDLYGSSDTVMAFALLGWCRGQAYSAIDGAHRKEVVTDRYTTPKRQRTFVCNGGTVTTEDGQLVGTYGGSSATPAGAPKARKPHKPRDSKEREPQPPESVGFCKPEFVLMRKDMLTKLSPELRKVFREVSDHRWVGRSITQACNLLAAKRGNAAMKRELLGLCWVPVSKIPADGELV